MHSGSLNFQFDGGTQQEKSGILMANIANAKVIDVDITRNPGWRHLWVRWQQYRY